MSRKVHHITLNWSGGTHRFQVEPPQSGGRPDPLVVAAEGLPFAVMHDRLGVVLTRLTTNQWGREDIADTIRTALINGGGFKRKRLDKVSLARGWPDADALVAQHVEARPWVESLALAQTICMAAIFGIGADLADQGMEPATMQEVLAAILAPTEAA